MILCGHEGDKQTQPSWAKDGSFLVFRDLQQLVPEFDTYVVQLVLVYTWHFVLTTSIGSWKKMPTSHLLLRTMPDQATSLRHT